MLSKELALYMRPEIEDEKGFVYILVDPLTNHWPIDGDVKIEDVEVLFHPPAEMTEEELRLKAIETLKEKQERIRANAHRDIAKLDDKIQSLMFLTHQPEPSDNDDININDD